MFACYFSGTWSQQCPGQAPAYKTGWNHQPTTWACVSVWFMTFWCWGPKTPSSRHANTTIFWICIPRRSMYLSYVCTEWLPHLSLTSTFPRHASDHPASLSQKYPKPLTHQEIDSRLVLLSPHWDAAWINLFSVANLSLSAFVVQHTRQTSLVLEHRKSAQADLDLQGFIFSPSQNCSKLRFAFNLPAWLFSLLSVPLNNLTNASRWTPEYSLHLSYLRRSWPQVPSS